MLNISPPTPDQSNGSVEVCNWLPDLDRGAGEQRAVSNLRQRHQHLVPASGLLLGRQGELHDGTLIIMNTREPPHLLRPPRAQQTVVPPPGEGGGRVPAQVGAGQPQLVCCGAPPPGAPPPPHPRPRHQLPVHTDQGGRGAVWGVGLYWSCSMCSITSFRYVV